MVINDYHLSVLRIATLLGEQMNISMLSFSLYNTDSFLSINHHVEDKSPSFYNISKLQKNY